MRPEGIAEYMGESGIAVLGHLHERLDRLKTVEHAENCCRYDDADQAGDEIFWYR